MARKSKGGSGLISNNTSTHPSGPDLGPVRYGPYQQSAVIGKPGNLLDETGRPVSSMTRHPINKGVGFNPNKARTNEFNGDMSAGEAFAKRKQTPTQGNQPLTIK